MKPFRLLFRAEALLNFFSGGFAMLAPASFANMFMPADAPLANAEMARWFGAMTIAFGFVLWRALDLEWPTLKPVIEAYLLGDVLFFFALVAFVSNGGAWTGASVFSTLSTIILGVARVICLTRPALLYRAPG
ncbi:MAG: hypothetical protein IT323_16345 [Anaerolineae bacterium]|nr:hypothetical protein [Anaerolineae bacterium]